MPWLFLLFVVVPAVELALLIQLGQWIGVLETFGLILATGLLGSYMAKTQGLSVWKSLSQKLASGGLPGNELTDGAIILVSGTLLITPGVITDFVGLLGLIPWTRALIRRGLQSFLKRQTTMNVQFGSFRPADTMPQEPIVDDHNRTDVRVSGKAKPRPSQTTVSNPDALH